MFEEMNNELREELPVLYQRYAPLSTAAKLTWSQITVESHSGGLDHDKIM